jgi:hypothetical protein
VGCFRVISLQRFIRLSEVLSPHTEFELKSDGHGGTDLTLVYVVGVQHHEAAIHFGPGPHF